MRPTLQELHQKPLVHRLARRKSRLWLQVGKCMGVLCMGPRWDVHASGCRVLSRAYLVFLCTSAPSNNDVDIYGRVPPKKPKFNIECLSCRQMVCM